MVTQVLRGRGRAEPRPSDHVWLVGGNERKDVPCGCSAERNPGNMTNRGPLSTLALLQIHILPEDFFPVPS